MLMQAISSTMPTTTINIDESCTTRLGPCPFGLSRASSNGTAVALRPLLSTGNVRSRLAKTARRFDCACSIVDARLQAAEAKEEQTAPRVVPVEARLRDQVHRNRQPDGRPAAEQRAGEVLRGDADDRERRPVERDRLADDLRIRAEAALPETLAEHRNRRGLGLFLRQEPAAERRLGPEQREVVAGDELRRDLFGFLPRAVVHRGEGERPHVGERCVLRAEVLEIEVRNRQVAGVALIRRGDRGQRHRRRSPATAAAARR